jgi:hypothetical protein
VTDSEWLAGMEYKLFGKAEGMPRLQLGEKPSKTLRKMEGWLWDDSGRPLLLGRFRPSTSRPLLRPLLVHFSSTSPGRPLLLSDFAVGAVVSVPAAICAKFRDWRAFLVFA